MRKLWLILSLPVLAIMYATPALAATDISVVAIPNPIGIPEILLVVALLGFALWKKGWVRILLSICIIIWGVFCMPYDIKIAAPLVAVGSVLLMQAILALIQHAREAT